jgi:hypothetical protein
MPIENKFDQFLDGVRELARQHEIQNYGIVAANTSDITEEGLHMECAQAVLGSGSIILDLISTLHDKIIKRRAKTDPLQALILAMENDLG